VSIRVLHFYSTFFPDTVGGAEAAIDQICQSTLRFDVIPQVLALSHKPDVKRLSLNGYEIVRCQTQLEIASTRFSIDALMELRQMVRDVDLVHYHFPYPFADVCQLLLGVDRPYVVTYHSDIVKQKLLLKLYRPLMRKFLGGAQRIVATSPNYLASSQTLDEFRDKVCVIPLAIGEASYPPTTEHRLEKWRHLSKTFFLFVGVLRYYKGIHLLIEAVRGTDLQVVIVGDGVEAAKLRRQAAGLTNVIFLGKVSEADKIDLLSLAYAFVFPSHLRSEAFGVSLLEAALFGLPAIAFDQGTGTSFVIEDGVTGILACKLEENTSSEVASAALRVAMNTLRRDTGLKERLGDAAKRRSRTVFSEDAMGSAYSTLYRSCLTTL
jgi:O-antigen biosynthesis rhamnosyltransferase